jgi:hypothetical protein
VLGCVVGDVGADERHVRAVVDEGWSGRKRGD